MNRPVADSSPVANIEYDKQYFISYFTKGLILTTNRKMAQPYQSNGRATIGPKHFERLYKDRKYKTLRRNEGFIFSQ